MLIDTDSIIYKAGYSNEHVFYHVFYKDNLEFPAMSFHYMKDAKAVIRDSSEFVVQKEVVIGPLAYSISNVKRIVSSIQDACKCYDFILVLSSRGETIKHAIAKTLKYKGNRDPNAKPAHYEELRRFIEKNYPTLCIDGVEADDVIGSLATKIGVGKYTICSIDKDLQLIEGNHFNYSTNESFYVTQEDAEDNFWTLMLVGDSADNIKGISGIGPVNSKKILNITTDKETIVKDLYKREFKDKWEERYKENYDLIRLHSVL